MAKNNNLPRGLKNKLVLMWPIEQELERLKQLNTNSTEVIQQIAELTQRYYDVSIANNLSRQMFNQFYYDKKVSDDHEGRFVCITKADLVKLIKENISSVSKITDGQQQVITNDEIKKIPVLNCEVPSGGKRYIFVVALSDEYGANCKDLLKDTYLMAYNAPNIQNEFYSQVFDLLWDYNRKNVETLLDNKIATIAQYTQELNPMDKQLSYVQLTLRALLQAQEKDADKQFVGTKFVDEHLETLKGLYDDIAGFEAKRMGLAKNADLEKQPQLESFREDCQYRLDKLKTLRQVLFKEWGDEDTDNNKQVL